MSAPAFKWSPAEREAWRLPEAITPSEWADQHRKLHDKLSSEPGRWHTSRTPYLRDIMDAFVDPEVEQITVMKSTQVGMTECLLNLVGYAIDQDPGPMLYVMPTEEDARSIASSRLRKLIESTEAVGSHTTGKPNDIRGALWEFDRMNFKLGWAESDASLASFASRYVMLDELGKYRNSKGKVGADRVKLAYERTRTYPDTRKVVAVSTPEDEDDLITREFELSDKRSFWVPCPHCGTFAPFIFDRDKDRDRRHGHRFHFDTNHADPERIRREKLAWFACADCERKIVDGHRVKMNQRGVWCPQGATVNKAGVVVGNYRRTSNRGFHVWAANSPWVPLGDIASEWLIAQGDIELLKSHVNNVFGEPWAEKSRDVSVVQIATHIEKQLPAATVPEGALRLTLGADVQDNYLVYSVRAWLPGMTSLGVKYGRVDSFEQLWGEVIDVDYPVASPVPKQRMRIALACIDSGHRQDEVYSFCRQHLSVCRPTKGAELARAARIKVSAADKDMRGRPIAGGLQLWSFDVFYFKNQLERLMNVHADEESGTPAHWRLHAPDQEGAHADYFLQVTSEERRKFRRGGGVIERWVPKKGRTQNHYWDCEVLNVLAADMLGLSWRSKPEPRTSPSPEPAPRAPVAPTETRRGADRRGWIGGRSQGGWIRR